jgi:prolyl oligopeptidase
MNIKKTYFILSVVLIFVFSGFAKTEKSLSKKLTYPKTRTVDQVDDYFGTKVADPYRWLEGSNDKVRNWINSQNQVTFSYLKKIPYRSSIKRRLKELVNYPRYSSPSKAGGYYFFYKNDGLQNQSVIYIQKGLDGKPEVFLDPNALSKDGTVRAYLAGFSQDYKHVAYIRSEGGSDWLEIRIMEIETKKELPDRIKWVKFSGASWDKGGFYYSGYPQPEEGKQLTAKNRFHKLYYHKLGDPQGKDRLIYEDPKHPMRYYFARVTEDHKFLILNSAEGTHGSEVHYKDLTTKKSEFKLLFKGFEFNYRVIDTLGGKFLVQTNQNAPNQKLILIDPVTKETKDLIPEGQEVMRGADIVGGKLFVSYLKDATTQIYRYDLKGKNREEIRLPGIGTAYGFGGEKTDEVIFYTYTSFNYPPTIYKYEIKTGKSEVFRKTEVTFNPDNFIVKQVFYESKDKTKIPMFLIYKKGLKRDSKNPVYLYAYGGFNASLTPYFNNTRILLLENGFIFAMANLRGGGEYGEKWHEAGMLLKKQNVFDDFNAAAEYLINNKYTCKNKIAIAGASNGGLLVGACMTQRPDLFKVALPTVGVMDMLRYHKFTVGWGWVVEYGSSDKEEDFKNLYSYSPLHNIKEGVNYPATLATTADHDDRVVPAHSFKFIANLQKNHKGNNPVLIRIETKSGHGSSSLSKRIETTADIYAFMFHNLRVKPIYKD